MVQILGGKTLVDEELLSCAFWATCGHSNLLSFFYAVRLVKYVMIGKFEKITDGKQQHRIRSKGNGDNDAYRPTKSGRISVQALGHLRVFLTG